MLTFLFQNNFSSDEVWKHLENYFLGILPTQLLNSPVGTTKSVVEEDVSIQFQIGNDLKADCSDWKGVKAIFDSDFISQLDSQGIPLADYYGAKLIIGEKEADVELAWSEQKIALTSGKENDAFRTQAAENGWTCFPINAVMIDDLKPRF